MSEEVETPHLRPGCSSLVEIAAISITTSPRDEGPLRCRSSADRCGVDGVVGAPPAAAGVEAVAPAWAHGWTGSGLSGPEGRSPGGM